MPEGRLQRTRDAYREASVDLPAWLRREIERRDVRELPVLPVDEREPEQDLWGV